MRGRSKLTGNAWRGCALRLALLLAVCLGGVGACSAQASAAPKWDIQSSWGPTALEPGGDVQFALFVTNYGDSASKGTVTVVDKLPQGVTATSFAPTERWSCSGSTIVVCTTLESVEPLENLDRASSTGPGFQPIFIDASVSPGAVGEKPNTASVSGGGALEAAVQTKPVTFASTPFGFGVIPSSFDSNVFDGPYPGGETEHQAGTHPYEMRVNFDFNENYGRDPNAPEVPYTDVVGRVRTVDATLPRGLIGNPQQIPKCTGLEFLGAGSEALETTGCPPDTQVGFMSLRLANGFSRGGYESPFRRVAVYNLVPPRGQVADFGFQVGSFVVGHIYAQLDPARDYAISSVTPYIANVMGVRSVRFTMWGVPADPSHDIYRAYQKKFLPNGEPDEAAPHFGAPYTGTVRPFLTMPMDCGVDNGPFHIIADSWNHPGEFTPNIDSPSHLEVNGCEDQRVRFHPQVKLNPTSRAAGGPTGLDVHLEVPQRDQTVENYEDLYAKNGDQHGIDTPPMKKVVVTFPEGMTLSTSAAQGLTGCTPAEIGLGTNDPVTCPDSSQYGQLTLHTPLLPPDEPMRGFIYIAQQSHNPFGTFLALYLVIEDPDRGLRIKIPGRLDLNERTGQITATFDDLPQFPMSDMQLTFKGGVRAGLVNPPTCGSKTITATFYSWAAPSTPLTRSSSYQITQRPDGGSCVHDLGERQFQPGFEAGTVNPSAGAYSPFVFRLTRDDEDQEFSQVDVNLPEGLSAKIAGLTQCSDSGIAQAISRTAAGDGALEQTDPSCPASSEIGSTEVGTGVGQVLTFIGGKAYLAGPYHGAPLSMVVISPVTPGPYDLGVIAVRSALEVNPETTQITVKSEPFPQIYQGIPVRIRDIRVSVDRPETTINPTSCEPAQISAHITGTGGDLLSTADDTGADVSQRFQVANCASLSFKPKLTLQLRGKTKRSGTPALRAVLRMPPGSANIAAASVTLPHSEFLDNAHIKQICTRVEYAAGAGGGSQCRASSVYGFARAWTPLLDHPLEGPVYLRSSNHQLPDLVASLNGQIHVDLDGRIDSHHGGIRNSFELVPDAPVTKFELKMSGGKKSLLENSSDLCTRPHFAAARFTAHSGKQVIMHPTVRVKCKRTGRKHGTHAKHNRR